MTNVNHTLDPIRPDNGTVGDNMPSVDVEVVQVQEEIIGEDGIENADKDAEVEEMRKPKPAARPYTPTRAEVYEHEVTHLPFRSWCKHCVHGRGVSSPHVRPDKKEKIGITISMDYCFMNGEEDDDPSLPGVLIIWDDNHECLWALPVEKKGPVEWVVKWIVEKLDNVGYRG